MPAVPVTQAWTDISVQVSSIVSDMDQNTMLWTLIFGFIMAFILAFAVGANDVANSFGTTVGAEVLTLKAACILASIFETLGAVLLGAKVGETIRKGIIDVSIYNTSEYGRELLMIGEVSAMSGAAIWQLIATVFGLPVSGTHSIVGACIGFSLVAVGATGVNWTKLGFIIASWFISPVLSGVLTISLYYVLRIFILEKDDPLQNGLRFLPFFYAFTLGINGFSILYSGAPLLGLDHLPIWGIVLITLAIMIVTALVVQLVAVPRVRRKARKAAMDLPMSNRDSSTPVDRDCNRRKSSFDPDRTNDSGYQTPQDSCKKTMLILSTEDDESMLQMDAQASDSLLETSLVDSEKANQKWNNVVGEEEEAVPKGVCLRDSEDQSYDGDDSDSAYDVDCKLSKSQSDGNGLKSREEEKHEAEMNTDDEDDPLPIRILFSFLQIITACFGSFAHGGNDVSNAIGPLIALWLIYHSGNVVQKAATPWYLLLYGGAGIVVGLWVLGRRVIQTIGKNLTKITPSRGFCIELMTALTVLIASNIGIPVSTTHCKVGAVVSIGWFRSRNAVQWSMVRNIALAWFVTVPVSGLISAGVMYLLMNTAM